MMVSVRLSLLSMKSSDIKEKELESSLWVSARCQLDRQPCHALPFPNPVSARAIGGGRDNKEVHICHTWDCIKLFNATPIQIKFQMKYYVHAV